MELHVLATLSQGKSPQYPLNRRLGGPQSQSGHSVLEKNPQPRWELNPDHPIIQPTLPFALAIVSGAKFQVKL
jgi:hypothetical protein